MASTKISRTFGTPTSRKIGTFSFWMKLSNTNNNGIISNFGDNNNRGILYMASEQLKFYDAAAGDNPYSSRKLRDRNAWYHIVVRIDTTQGTAADRFRIYINGEQDTLTNTAYVQNEDSYMFNTNTTFTVGRDDSSSAGADYFNGLISHFYYCDGQSYAPTVFGSTDSTTGEWKINTSPSVTYGNQGFLILKDGNTITDQSTNSNNFSLIDGTLTKTEDNPSNVFATLNPLDQAHISTQPTIAYGNTQWTASGNSTSNCSIRGTIGASSGKYYFEVKLLEATNQLIGVDCPDVAGAWYDNTGYMGNHSGFYAILINSTDTIRSVVAGSGGGTDLGTVTNNDIIGCAFDFDNGKFYFSKNGTYISVGGSVGDPTSGSSGTGAFGTLASGFYVPAITNYSYGTASSTAFNFGNGYFGTTAVSSAGTNASGNGIFEYDCPNGYTAFSTKGLNL